MTMLRVGGLPAVLTLSSDCRQESGEKMDLLNFGSFVYVWDEFLQQDFVLWVLCARIMSIYVLTLFYLHLVSILLFFYGFHAQGYHAPSTLHGLSRLRHGTATTPVCLNPGYHAKGTSSNYGLPHLSYHAPPHT